MLFKNLRALRVTAASLLLFTLSSCASVGGGLSAGLIETLGQVTSFSSSITDWQSSLGGMLDDAGLSQLKEFAGQAGGLGEKISGMTDGLSEAMQDPMKAIGGKLVDMSGLDVDGLKSMAPTEQMDAIKGFGDSASGVGDLASDFLKQFGG